MLHQSSQKVNSSRVHAEEFSAIFLPLKAKELWTKQKARNSSELSAGKEISHALATVHVELLLIHPFREGNGRLARMLASLMALQAELPPLDFSMLKGKKKQEYFVAVQTGISQNYEPMEKIFDEVIERTLRLRSRSFR